MTDDLQMPAIRPPRLTIQLAEHQLKLLTLWAKFNGKPTTTFAGQIVASRIEANAADIMQSVKIAAQMENISEDEIIERWLGDSADDES